MNKNGISIVIPTYNEEKYITKLLHSITLQTYKPVEVIVADAFSTDTTRKIARGFGCRVIDGGSPAKARNNGAKKATQNLILFLDADVVLPPTFLEMTVAEMKEKKLKIASCLLQPLSSSGRDFIMHEMVNYYLRATKHYHPHVPGCCIFVERNIHSKTQGFDESLFMAEDHAYVKRAKKYGKFSYLKSHKISVSTRRLHKEGRMRLAMKYIAVELHLILFGQIRRKIFAYEYGRHRN